MTCATLVLAGLATWHVVAFVVIVLLLFGGQKLPELARGLARGLRIFRDELHGTQKDVEHAVNPPPPASSEAAPPTDQKKP